jgi:membrane fusion protein (multidrug efflux system)
MTKLAIAVAILLVIAGGWFWARHRGEPAEAGASDKPVARVTTATLQRQAISRTVEAYGIVAAAPSGERVIAAAFDCMVRKVNVRAGTRVGAGQVLLEIDPAPDAKLALETARSVRGLAAKAFVAAQQRYDLKLATGQDLLAA